MNDSRLEHARILIVNAIRTNDETYMRALLVDAQKDLSEVVNEL